LQFQTISFKDPEQFDKKPFLSLHQYLEKTFPKVHSSLQKEVIGDFSLLFTWRGQDPELKPFLLMAHTDVVPVESGTEGDWIYPPFDGHIADGYIWGRGAMDDKASVFGILEAVEWLLEEGFQPQRTFYLAFGHDEEVGGIQGASQIAALLQSRNIELEYVLDEGLAIVDGTMLGIPKPVALVGIAEKGNISIELIVEIEGGHSSIPGQDTSIGILSRAVHRLEENPMSARMEAPTRQMFDCIGTEMKFLMQMMFANQWLFGGMLKRNLASSLVANAMIRTVTATTLFQGGVKENVLPKRARATVNFRILTGDTIVGVLEHVKMTINDPRIKVTPLREFKSEPSPVSDIDSLNFALLQRTIRQVFPEVIIAPGLGLGASDSRHYAKLSSDVYRFVPYRFAPEDISRIHGTNERISVEGYKEIIKFYIQLIRNSTQ
ncbi:M20 family peptidase, partial [bacterium]|nr:M20 family peptidase [bacterium]